MARYRGAVCRICRPRYEALSQGRAVLRTKCSIDGARTRQAARPAQRKVSDYGCACARSKGQAHVRAAGDAVPQLLIKRRTSRGITGEVLIQSLERRLDNVAYRSGTPGRGARRASSCCTGRCSSTGNP